MSLNFSLANLAQSTQQTVLPQRKTFDLFKKGKVTPQFNNALTEILSNPVPREYILNFSKHSFLISSGSLLGSGGRNLIFEATHLGTGKKVALRIQARIPIVGPWHKDVLVFLATCANPFSYDRIHIVDSIGEWFRAYQRLTTNGARVVPLHQEISDSPEFLAITLRTIKMPYWLYKAVTQGDLDHNTDTGKLFKSRLAELGMTLDELDQNFCDFVASLAGYSMIGDFRSDQMAASVEGGWEIYDMSDEYRTSSPYNLENPFETNLSDNLTNVNPAPMQKMIVKPGFPPRVADYARACFREGLKKYYQKK